MIDYKQLESGTPPDVEVITDDKDAEMIAFDEMIKETGFEIELPDERDADENFRFVVPGEAVGEFADCVYDIDKGKLEEQLNQWNEDALKAAESKD